MGKALIEEQIRQGIAELTEGRLIDYTEGLSLRAYHRGRLKVDFKMGKTYKIYDLASLTKILFTSSVLMRLYERGKFRPNDRLQTYLSWWPYPTTIKELLTHTGGLPWWRPFYREVQAGAHSIARRDFNKELARRRGRLKRALIKEKPSRSRKSVYSDLDFLLLGFLIEEIAGESLLSVWEKYRCSLGFKTMHFNLFGQRRQARRFYAPTTSSHGHKRLRQGGVNDQNTWALGGVSSHAGLFGTMSEVAHWGLELRKGIMGKKNLLASPRAIRLFTGRALPKSQGDFALGFMLPTKGAASCGSSFSSSSVGHTGFTGTSFWFDPMSDLMVILISNRKNPPLSEEKAFRSLRPRIHDLVVRALLR